MTKACDCVLRTTRRIVDGLFYDSQICEKCGQIINPGSKRFSVKGPKEREKEVQIAKLRELGWKTLNESHGSTHVVVLVAPWALKAPNVRQQLQML